MKQTLKVLGMIVLLLILSACKDIDCDDGYTFEDGVCILSITDYTIEYYMYNQSALFDEFKVETTTDISSYELIDDVEMDGVIFNGWFLDEELTQDISETSELPTTESTIMLYGSYELQELTISFVVPEELDPISATMVTYGLSVTEPTVEATREYKWYTDESLETLFDFGSTITEDTTLYLGFDPIEYTIVYNVFSEIWETVKTWTPSSITSLPQPADDNLTFVGWYLDEALTAPVDATTLVFDPETPTIQLYAKMEMRMYTLSWILGGEVVAAREYYLNDVVTPYSVSEVPYTVFSGWFLDPEFTQPFNMIYMPSEDISVYGEYQIIDGYSSYTSISSMIADDIDDEFVEFTGVVAIDGYQCYLTDGERNVRMELTEPCSYERGTRVSVVGIAVKAVNNYILHDIIATDVLASDIPITSEPLVQTIPEHFELYSDEEQQFGFEVTLTGWLQYNLPISTSYYTLEDDDGNTITFSNDLHDDFSSLVGSKVELTFVYEEYLITDESVGARLTFNGSFDDDVVVLDTMSEEEMYDADVEWILNSLPTIVSYSVVIYEETPYGSMIGNLGWSNPTIFSLGGTTIINYPEVDDYEIILYLFIGRNDELNQLLEIPMYITKEIDLDDLMVEDDFDYVYIQGMIYHMSDSGVYLVNNDSSGYVYVEVDYLSRYYLEVGQMVYMYGEWFDGIVHLTRVSYGVTGPIQFSYPTLTGDYSSLYNGDYPYGTTVRTTAYVEYDDLRGLYHLTDTLGTSITIDPSSNATLLLDYIGEWIDVSVFVGYDEGMMYYLFSDDIVITESPLS